MKTLMVLAFGLTVAAATARASDGITTICKGKTGATSYELAIYADTDSEGGYRLTEHYDGPYPTVGTDLGTTRVVKVAGRVLTIELKAKVYMFDAEGLDIPSFLAPSDVHAVDTVVIDLGNEPKIKATLRQSELICV